MYSTGINKKKGSLTVEASVVIPLVILSITAVIYLGLLLYQRSLLQNAADEAAEMGAAVWAVHLADIDTGKTVSADSGSDGLYWRIFDTEKKARLDRVTKYAENLANKNNLLKPVDSEIQAEVRDYVVYKRLEVTIEKSYRLPVGRFLKIFGANEYFKISVVSYSVIDDPVELIRNTDFIIDVEAELEKIYPGLNNLGEKTRGILGDIKGNIKRFAD